MIVYVQSTNGATVTLASGAKVGVIPQTIDNTSNDFTNGITNGLIRTVDPSKAMDEIMSTLLPVPGYQYGKTTGGVWVPIQVDANGVVQTAVTGSNAISGDLVTVPTPGTRVQLPNVPCREVTLIGLINNTGKIYAGSSNVSSTHYGVALQSKDSFTFAVSNADMIYIDADNAGEGISYVAV